MRLPKFLIVISTMTLLAMIYVHQQTAIFYLAYAGEKKQANLQELLDRNNILRYNTSLLSSLPYLDKKLFVKNSDFEIPQEQRLVKLNLIQEDINITNNLKKRENLFSVNP
jgi:hypothetical protein